jgi:hypothetical protein
MVEYLNTFDAPKLTDAEIAAIDEAGAKEYHRQFVRSSFRIVLLLSADKPDIFKQPSVFPSEESEV